MIRNVVEQMVQDLDSGVSTSSAFSIQHSAPASSETTSHHNTGAYREMAECFAGLTLFLIARNKSRTLPPLYFLYFPKLLVNTLSARENQSLPTTSNARDSSATIGGSGGSRLRISKPVQHQLVITIVEEITDDPTRRIKTLASLPVSRRMDASNSPPSRV